MDQKKIAPSKVVILLLCLILIAQAVGFQMAFEQQRHPPLTANEGKSWDQVNKLEKQEMLNRAHYLLNMYFEGEVIITGFESGPANTLMVKYKIGSNEYSAVLLGDKDHLIVGGTIYSPYMTAPLLTSAHSQTARNIAGNNGAMAKVISANKTKFLRRQSAKPAQSAQSAKPGPSARLPRLKMPEVNTVFGQDKKRKIFEKAEKLQFIEFGKKDAPLVYVLFDFECSGCRATEKVLKKYTDSGALRVRFIPVGVISKESPLKAAYSLIPKENEKRKLVFERFTQNKTFAELVATPATKDQSNRAFREVISANNLFQTLPRKLTPTFIYDDGHTVSIAAVTSEAGIRKIIAQIGG